MSVAGWVFARDLAGELRRLRAESGLGLVQLAVRTNYSKSSLERYLNGKVLPPRRAVESISKACGGDTPRLLALWELACQPPPAVIELRHAGSGVDGLGRVADLGGPAGRVLGGGGLPGEVDHFTGRQGPVEDLLRRVEAHDPAGSVAAVYVVDGMPGVGKTAFAIHVAHALAGRYPDGAIFVDLLGYSGPKPLSAAQALDELLAQAGVQRAQIPGEDGPKQALWQRLMRGRRALIVLDNARDAEQVEPLLPHSAGSLVLITARSKLYELDAAPLPLPVLDVEEARGLFVAVAGGDRCRSEAAVEQIVAGCHRLPLALRLMAGRVRHGDPIEEIADDVTGLPEEKKIRGVFDLSYNGLDAELQRAVRLLGVYPGIDITGPVMAALAGTSPDGGRRLLRGLATHNLIERSTDQRSQRGSQVRYQPHDLARDYARFRADAHELPAARQAALDRLVAHYLTMTRAAKQLHAHREGSVFPDLAHAHAWLTGERANLLACLDNSPIPSIDLATTAAWLAGRLSYWRDARHCCRLALTYHRRTGNRQGEADALWKLADFDRLLDRYEAAQHQFEQARDIFREIGNRRGEADALRGLADLDRMLDRCQEAEQRYEQARDIFRDVGDRRGEADALWGLAEVDRLVGRCQAAHYRFEQARDIFREIGNRSGKAHSLRGLADLDVTLGRPEAAQQRYEQARDIFQEIGDRRGEADALRGLADLDVTLGRPEAAQQWYEQAYAIYQEIGNRSGGADALRGLAEVDRLLGRYQAARQRYEQARDTSLKIGDRHGEAYALWCLGKVAEVMEDADTAANRWREALQILDALQLPFAATVRDCLTGLDHNREVAAALGIADRTY